MIALLVGAALFGAAIGSFFNVVVWRLPRGESLVRPRSRCPRCETPIRPWHNVPVVSWLALRGRCADCAAPIPARYPLVEAATAALYAGVVAATGADRDAILGLLLVSALVPIALIDLDHRRIPNVITGPAALAAVAALAVLNPGALPGHLLAGALAAGAFFVVALVAPGGMGMGDVKLAGVLGLYLGRAVAPSSPPGAAWRPRARPRCPSGRSSRSAAWPACSSERSSSAGTSRRSSKPAACHLTKA